MSTSKDTEDVETAETAASEPKASGSVRRSGAGTEMDKDRAGESTTAPAAKDDAPPAEEITPEVAESEQGPAAGGGAEADEARTPAEIRADIEETRVEMGDTVEALAEKSDVKGQAKARVEELKGRVQEKREQYTAKAKDTTPESAQQSAQNVLAKVQANPTPVIVGAALLAGILIGRRG